MAIRSTKSLTACSPPCSSSTICSRLGSDKVWSVLICMPTYICNYVYIGQAQQRISYGPLRR
ncbi:hypothetical protein DYH55_02105 [Methylovirgula sp. 4M-Z18]|nr:hypothetical protein DYH55_02105 [Methylovirgula sp. 4M-Z18]